MNDNLIYSNNEKVKKILFLASSLVYNFIIGFFSFLIYILTSWSMIDYKNYIGIVEIFIFIILLIPFNIYIKKKIKLNIALYLMFSILSYVLGVGLYMYII